MQNTLVTWLANMTSDDCEDVLAGYAEMVDPDEPEVCKSWVARVRGQAAALRQRAGFAGTLH